MQERRVIDALKAASMVHSAYLKLGSAAPVEVFATWA
jgi:hypothetical protein